MKKTFILLFLLPITVFAQNWQWAKQIGSNSSEYGKVITDGTNSYIIGRFGRNLYLQTDTLYLLDNNDMMIIKYDQNGKELWARGFGGDNGNNQYEDVYGVYDSTCNCIYLAGNFYGTMYLSPTLRVSSHGGNNLFLAKIDLNGTFQWAKKIDSVNTVQYGFPENSADVFINSYGEVLLTGRVRDTSYFDTKQVNPGGFLARYDNNGNCVWAKHLYNNAEQSRVWLNFINHDLIMYGNFQGNNFNIDTATFSSHGGYDFFIARADSFGNIKWITSFGGYGIDGISDVSVDNSNNIYAVGGFSDTVILNNLTLANKGKDILITKYSPTGNLIWARQTNAINNTGAASSIISDVNGNCYVTGGFSGSASFGSFNISTPNQNDMFLARYNNSGECLGVRHFGNAWGNSVVTDNSGNLICAGTFSGSVNIGNNLFTSLGGNDIYLAKSDAITDTGGEYKMAHNNSLNIYANPTTGKCNITIPDDFLSEKNLTLTVFDNSGKLIQQVPVQINENKISLNLAAEAKGIYNVTLSNGVKSYSGRIVFE